MKKTKGFGLAEILVYIAILSAFSALAVSSILMMMKAFGNISLSRAVNASAQTAVERIIREVRFGDDIDAISSFGSHPGRLKLLTVSATSGLPTTVDFALSGSTLTVAEGAALPENLTPSEIAVTSLVFYKILASDKSTAIKVEIELMGTKGNFVKTEKFYGTAVLRRSY